MTNMPMSRCSAALLRALIARAGIKRDRILLISSQSVDWQSLTFTGERHVLTLRLMPPQARESADRFSLGLDDHEFEIPGAIVADIKASACAASDGSVEIRVEALTISD